MKKPLLLLCAQSVFAANSIVSLNGIWTVGGEGRPVHVPHTASELVGNNISASRADEGNEGQKKVRFERRFLKPAVPANARIWLEIDNGDSLEAELNGKPAGKAPELQFTLLADVTSLLKPGENSIAVLAAATGIHGGVRLRIQEPLRLDNDGVLVDTPSWQGGPARVRVRTEIINDSPAPQQAELAITFTGPDGKPLAPALLEKREVPAGGRAAVDSSSASIAKPPLWSPDTPRLCKVSAELRIGGKVVESRQATFGFRWFRFDANKGFFLNGSPLKLHGTVYPSITPKPHPSRASLWQYEMDILKGMGLNFIRLTPQQDDEVLDACDRAGLLTTERIHDFGDSKTLRLNMRRDVRTKYNHPSVIAWNYVSEGADPKVAALQSEAARYLREFDATRLVLGNEIGWRSPGTVGLLDADIAGDGNYTGWYEGTLDFIGPYIDTYRKFIKERYGRDLPIVVSNYGAAADSNIHSDHPRRNDYSHEYHTAFHRRWHKEIEARPWLAGGMIFAFRDLEAGMGIPRHTWKGMVDGNEKKRDAYYYYQSVWTTKPMVHIAQDSWTDRNVWPAGSARTYEVFSNCPKVELFHNGKSLGSRTKAQGFSWTVPLVHGKNTLRAAGQGAEETVAVTVQSRPPQVEARLGKQLLIEWDAIPGVSEYRIYSGESAKTEARTSKTSHPAVAGQTYRVAAVGPDGEGPQSEPVGFGPGLMQWRFVQNGWLMGSPVVTDLDGDGQPEIVIGSYDGHVYAVNNRGRQVWDFNAGTPVISTPYVGKLAPGETPSVVFTSHEALFVLSATGQLRWKHEGLRTFDRNRKSPAVGDLDGDGRQEIVVPSDTGEVLAFDASGKQLWRFATAGEKTLGVGLTDLRLVGTSVLFATDNHNTYFLDGRGKVQWQFDHHNENVPGLVPDGMWPDAGVFEPGGPTRVVSGAGSLRMFDLDGKVLWERKDIRGMPKVIDGKIAITEPRHYFRLVDAKGKDLWKFPLPTARDYFTQAPIGADLDGDGRTDYLVGSRSTHLYAVGSDGKLLWKFQTDDEVSGRAAVADLDGDGKTEVVFGSRDGYLYVLGTGKTKQ